MNVLLEDLEQVARIEPIEFIEIDNRSTLIQRLQGELERRRRKRWRGR